MISTLFPGKLFTTGNYTFELKLKGHEWLMDSWIY
jgi:hypothetical protein